MAKILLIISIVLTLLTAVGGFLTKGKIDLLNQDLKARRAEVVKLTGEKNKLIADLKKTTDDLTAANKTIDDQKGLLATAANDLAASKAETEKAKMAQTEAEGKLTEATTKLADVQEKLDKIGPGVKPEDLQKLKEENDKMKGELAEARQVQDTFKTRAHEYEEKNAAQAKELIRYRLNVAKPGITGRVVAVNPGWNFVVVDVGDKRGAVVNAPLIVTRGGMTVARLKITAVEPASSVADVVPGSIPRGQSVQPGDSVIFAGRQPSAAPQEEAVPAGAAAALVPVPAP